MRICFCNNQGNFQLHRYTINENIAKFYVATFFTHTAGDDSFWPVLHFCSPSGPLPSIHDPRTKFEVCRPTFTRFRDISVPKFEKYVKWPRSRPLLTSFYRAALNAGRFISQEKAVRLSVKRVDCGKTEAKSVQNYRPYERSLSEKKNGWSEATPFTWNLGSTGPIGAKLPILNRYSLVAPQP